METLLKLCSQVYQQKRWIDRYQMRRAIGPKKMADTCTKKRAGKVGLNLRLCAGRSGGLSSERLTVAVIVRTRKEWWREKTAIFKGGGYGVVIWSGWTASRDGIFEILPEACFVVLCCHCRPRSSRSATMSSLPQQSSGEKESTAAFLNSSSIDA